MGFPGSTTCQGKVRHASKKDATTVLRRMPERTGAFWVLNVYPCQECGGWHIGNKQRARRSA